MPMLVTAGVVGGVGCCWRMAVHRAFERHVRHDAAAREAGWDYEPTEQGFRLTGRTLSCGWVLHGTTQGGARAALFAMGAPDERRAMLALGTGAAPRALAHAQRWPRDGTCLHERVWIEAHAPEDALRVLDADLGRLLADWTAPRRAGATDGARSLHAWLSPHGVQVASAHEPRGWDDIDLLVRLGIALGRRAGLA